MDNKGIPTFVSPKSATIPSASASPDGSQVALEQSYSECKSQSGIARKSLDGALPPKSDEDEPRPRTDTSSGASTDGNPLQKVEKSDSDNQVFVSSDATVRKKKPGGKIGHLYEGVKQYKAVPATLQTSRVIAPPPIFMKWPESGDGTLEQMSYKPNDRTTLTSDFFLVSSYTDCSTNETATMLSVDVRVESDLLEQKQPRERRRQPRQKERYSSITLKLVLSLWFETYDTERMISLKQDQITAQFPEGRSQIKVMVGLVPQSKVDKCNKKDLEIRVEPRVIFSITVPPDYDSVDMKELGLL